MFVLNSYSGRWADPSKTGFIRLLLVLITLMAALACFVRAQQTFTVSGTVTGPQGLIEGSQLTFRTSLGEFQRTTDAQGKFSAQVPKGFLELTADPPPGSDLLAAGLGVEVTQELVIG